MSFLSGLLGVVNSIFGGSGTGSALARSALIGYGLNYITKSIAKDNEADAKRSQTSTTFVDNGVRLQVKPSTESPIPVVYGQAYLGGYISDAQLVNNNQTMWFALSLCERTGTLLSTGAQSEITFQEVFWDGNRIEFDNDGVTAVALIAEDGIRNTDIRGLVQVYCYNNGSNSPVNVSGYTNPTLNVAQNLFPGWTSNHTMDQLAFAIVKVNYNAVKNIKSLGDVQFRLKNSMVLPGDVLNDYLINTRYGAGIAAEDISQI